MTLNQIVDYLSYERTEFNNDILYILKEQKLFEVSHSNEEAANAIWCYEQIFRIQKMYVDMFLMLKNENYFEAWKMLETVDIELSSLRENFDFSDGKFNLSYIQFQIREYEKIFPYDYFMSRESIIKKEECNICKNIASLRNKCSHTVGKVYMGELCVRNIIEFEIIAMALVKKPFDKYTVLFPEGYEYNYFMLENLMAKIDSPFDKWYVDILKDKSPEYQHIGRNDLCPCNSGKKYKKCCIDSDDIFINHHKITLLNKPKESIVPKIYGGTWKNRDSSNFV